MRIRTVVGVSVIALGTAMSSTVAVAASPSPGASSGAAGEFAPACLPSAAPGVAHCGAIQLLNPAANWQGSHGPGATPGKGPDKKPGGGGGSTTPSGYFPLDIQSAYGLTSAISAMATSATVQTVAVVDAYDDPNAESDLATYRSHFGLSACTTANGCFAKVNETGGTTSYPSASTSWSEEISLDLDMVSAACPGCHILLVEATSNSLGDLGTAVNTAVTLGANAVSNSYGAAEFSGETAYDVYYDHPGVAITASAGDGGYGVEYPAASPFVTAVGGTTLTGSSTTGWAETVWSGTGSGCSAYEAIPAWQPKTSLCATRTVADVAADANPSTGVGGHTELPRCSCRPASLPVVGTNYIDVVFRAAQPENSRWHARRAQPRRIRTGPSCGIKHIVRRVKSAKVHCATSAERGLEDMT